MPIADTLTAPKEWLPNRSWRPGTPRVLASIAVLFLMATTLGGVAYLNRGASREDRLHQGWLHLSRSRLSALGATTILRQELIESKISTARSLANYDKRRTDIELELTTLAEDLPELASSVRALNEVLDSLPRGAVAESESALHLSVIRVSRGISLLSTESPLEGDRISADQLARDVYQLQLAGELMRLTGRAEVDRPLALSVAAELTEDDPSGMWEVGEVTNWDGASPDVQRAVDSAVTSKNADLVEDASAWAAAAAGLVGSDETAKPNLSAAEAASSQIATTLSEQGTATITDQIADLGRTRNDRDGLSATLLYIAFGCTAVAFFLIAMRLRRSRIDGDKLRVAASTDRLTGLGNRSHLDAEVLLLAERSPEIVVLHIDLDHFKPVNDTYGHAVGDRVLQLTAGYLTTAADDHDGIAARLGGDEFVLVLPAIEPEEIEAISTSLLAQLHSFKIGQLDLAVGASIGVARGAADIGELLINADLALYQAKRTGRGQASTFKAEEAEFVTFVHETLLAGRVAVVYQPQVSLRDGRCVGAEVLARLVDRTGKLRPAQEWLGVAEWLGVTGELLEHAVTAVLDDLRRHPRFATPLWFNVAPADLIRPGGAEWLLGQLERLPIPISRLGIELTETEGITDPARLAVALKRLRTAGLGIALDDFGARNSPLGHLVDLPVTRVKLDSALIGGIGEDMPPSSWVVRAMTELAGRLNIQVMAEGVTSGAQVRLLARLGVPAAQGYLLGLPGPIDRIPMGVHLQSLMESSMSGLQADATGPLTQLGR